VLEYIGCRWQPGTVLLLLKMMMTVDPESDPEMRDALLRRVEVLIITPVYN